MVTKISLKVAAAQIDSVYGDISANLQKHLDCIADARSAGVEFLVFPELSLTGHSAGKEALQLSLDRNHEIIQQIAAASVGMHTVFGFIEEAPGAQFYNSAMAVRDGANINLHRKINLATYGRLNDGKYYAPGCELDDFAIDRSWRAATLICADLWNPALVHTTACRGITLLAAPISSAIEAVGEGFDNPGGWDINLRFYSMLYGCPIVMANRIGTEGTLNFWGGSRILDPFGNIVASATGLREQLVIAEVGYDAIRRARFMLPTIRDANATVLSRPSAATSKI